MAHAHQRAFQRCMLELDVDLARRLWQHVHPELKQPADDGETLLMLHVARIKASWLSMPLRRYSLAWVQERLGEPTLYNHILEPLSVTAVGYATTTRDTGLRRALLDGVSRTIEAAIADGVSVEDAKELRPLIRDAHQKIKHGGRVSI